MGEDPRNPAISRERVKRQKCPCVFFAIATGPVRRNRAGCQKDLGGFVFAMLLDAREPKLMRLELNRLAHSLAAVGRGEIAPHPPKTRRRLPPPTSSHHWSDVGEPINQTPISVPSGL